MTNTMAEKLTSDILSQDDVILSVNSGSGICEARVEKNLPFRIREQWATIGHEDKSWHIHLNLKEVVEARLSETRTNGLISYSIRFFDSKGNLAMRANFVKIYDKQGNIIQDRVAKYGDIFKKYGEEEIVYLDRK
jgi:putative heme iron utilization protein